LPASLRQCTCLVLVHPLPLLLAHLAVYPLRALALQPLDLRQARSATGDGELHVGWRWHCCWDQSVPQPPPPDRRPRPPAWPSTACCSSCPLVDHKVHRAPSPVHVSCSSAVAATFLSAAAAASAASNPSPLFAARTMLSSPCVGQLWFRLPFRL
jgi:hypothetical protein